MNQTEYERLEQSIGAILTKANADGCKRFICNLKASVDLTKLNIPKRALFAEVDELLTDTGFINVYGFWVIAECDRGFVQFSLMSDVEYYVNKQCEICVRPNSEYRHDSPSETPHKLITEEEA